MSSIASRLISKAMAQVAGSGVGIDDDGRLYFPDGLDPSRVHRFIELVMATGYANPKAALRALFERVGVPSAAVEAFGEVLSDEGTLMLSAIGRHPLQLGDESDATPEQAVVSTRLQAAEAMGCEASWDEILARPEEVGELAREWRESGATDS